MVTTTYAVQGMTCDHCVRSVEEEVSAVPGVSEVHADLETGQLTITTATELDPAAVAAAVDEAGYELRS